MLLPRFFSHRLKKHTAVIYLLYFITLHVKKKKKQVANNNDRKYVQKCALWDTNNQKEQSFSTLLIKNQQNVVQLKIRQFSMRGKKNFYFN